MRTNYRWNTHSMKKDGDINWTEHESNLKHHVRSNLKHRTKENAPGQTAAQVHSEWRISRMSSWKAESSFKELTYYLNYLQ